MNTKMIKQITVTLILVASFLVTSYGQDAKQGIKTATTKAMKKDEIKYKVTFIELGSVRCIPCQKMQPVMKSIETKYGKEVKVIFHDVWTSEGKPFATIFNIESIPTQVFLDENGKEFSRHVGYFPEEELVKVLEQKGVK